MSQTGFFLFLYSTHWPTLSLELLILWMTWMTLLSAMDRIVFPRSYILKLNLQRGTIWRQGLWEVIRFIWGHEDGVLMMGLKPLKEETRKLSFSSPPLSLCPPCKDTEKAIIYKPGREFLPEPDHAGTLILNIHPVELWEDKYLLFKPPSLWYLLWQPEQTRHYLLSCPN